MYIHTIRQAYYSSDCDVLHLCNEKKKQTLIIRYVLTITFLWWGFLSSKTYLARKWLCVSRDSRRISRFFWFAGLSGFTCWNIWRAQPRKMALLVDGDLSTWRITEIRLPSKTGKSFCNKTSKIVVTQQFHQKTTLHRYNTLEQLLRLF
jgi:hypothetical protein